MFPHPLKLTYSRCRKFAEIFGEFFCPGAREISRIIQLIIAKAIIAHSSKMGKEIRRPKGPSIVDILVLIPVAVQQVLDGILYTPVCWYSESQNLGYTVDKCNA